METDIHREHIKSMIFNSLEFAIFLPLVLMVYYSLSKKAQNFWLIGASYVFYGWWDWRFLFLIYISTLVDYYCARGVFRASSPGKRKLLLGASIATNLGILCFFKYFDFFVQSFAVVLQAMGFKASMPLLEIILPVGISFYTFQTMAYTIDVYRSKIKPCSSLPDFALYVAFFPQLVAGPIERPGNLLPQIAERRVVSRDALGEGLLLILSGLFRKMVIADTASMVVDPCFAAPNAYSGARLMLGAVFFAIQIYADFSGYTNIARGVAKLLGFELMENFRQPYLAASISDFWRRWHISLSTWFRDYLYIPLGGNRKGPVRTYFNLAVTMLLCGLWHGASWTFVAWGALHGVFLAVHRKAMPNGGPPTNSNGFRLRSAAGVFLTFSLVCFAWIFFRAPSIKDAFVYLSAMAQNPAGFGAMIALAPKLMFYVAGLIFSDKDMMEKLGITHVLNFHYSFQGVYAAALILGIMLYGGQNEVPFIYFQF